MTLIIVHVPHFLTNHDHGGLSNSPTQRPRSCHYCTFLCSSVLHFSSIFSIAACFATTSSYDAGGNFFMTASYSFISVFHFQPYSSGSGNSGDSICADFHCRAVKCARRTFSSNASYLGGIFCDSDCF